MQLEPTALEVPNTLTATGTSSQFDGFFLNEYAFAATLVQNRI